MTTNRQATGRWGEQIAAAYLRRQGYTILAHNWRTPYGEIDLVAQQKDSRGQLITVFVEVKTRTSSSFGFPEEAVNARKQDHMLNAAEHYLQEHPCPDEAWRIDVIAIQRFKLSRPPAITHFENAIEG